MKTAYLLIICTMLLGTATIANANSNNSFKYINIGKLPHKNKWVFAIPIINKSKHNIFIYRIQPSCHCISVNYPKEPLIPKQTKKIYLSVSFNKGKNGNFQKSLFIYLSNKKILIVKIKGVLY